MMAAFGVLARFKFPRGTAFDMFGRSAERCAERALIAEYEALIEELLGALSPANHGPAVDLASLSEQVRGFGPVKEASMAPLRAKRDALLAAWRNPGTPRLAA